MAKCIGYRPKTIGSDLIYIVLKSKMWFADQYTKQAINSYFHMKNVPLCLVFPDT